MAGHRTLPGRVMATTRRKPSRMVRLRIVLYIMLVLADIDFTNSKMHGRRTRRQEEHWRESPFPRQDIHGTVVISHPEVNGKAVVSSPEVKSKVLVSGSEVNGKAIISRTEVNSKASVSSPEEKDELVVSNLEVTGKAVISSPQVNGKVSVSSPEENRKAVVVSPKVNEQAVLSSPEVNRRAITSRPQVNDQVGISHSDVNDKVVNSRLEVNDKAVVSRSVMNSKMSVHGIAMVPHQWRPGRDAFSHPVVDSNDLFSCVIHRKVELSSLNIYKEVHGLDSNSNQLRQTEKGLNGCPSDCECGVIQKYGIQGIYVTKCGSSPIKGLPKLFELYRDVPHWVLLDCHLTTLPLEIEILPVIILNLIWNDFTEIPRVLLELPYLQQMFMGYNKLSTLPRDVNKWSGMTLLDLKSNLITELPQEIGEIGELRNLDISYNKLKSLPHSIYHLSHLENLILGNNKIKTLSPHIVKLTNLQRLYVDENELESLPQALCALSQLQQLRIRDNRIQLLPDCLDKLNQLQILDISDNEIKSLPMSIGGIPNLQELHMSNNKIETLPEEISALSHLEELYIDSNDLHDLPESLGSLSCLSYLNIYNNDLHDLPESLGSLSCLFYLNMSNNDLQELPESLGALVNLMALSISSNHLQALPQSIVNLKRLMTLNVSSNKLHALPHNMHALTNLLKLDLSNNPLGRLPDLPWSLQDFRCDYCSIQTFPCGLLFTAKFVSITYNGMTTFNCFKSHKFSSIIMTLNQLYLSGNSIEYMPCDSSVNEIIDISYNNISILPAQCNILQLPNKIAFGHNKLGFLFFSSLCTSRFRMNPLKSVYLNNNRITAIHMNVRPIYLQQCFQSGAIIDLRGNMLMVLDSWPIVLSQSTSKITIYLDNNNISEFTNSVGKAFCAIQYGSVFSMQSNQIKHFMDIFNGWKITVNTTVDLDTLLRNVYFDLGFNPLNCDCVDYEVYRSMKRTRSAQYQNLRCYEPLTLRGQNPRNISLLNFACDVELKCPHGCACTNVPHSQTINITCFSYTQTDIPERVPDLVKLSYKYRIEICHQNLNKLTPRPYMDKVSEIRLSNNSITAIKVDSSNAFKSLRVLHLDHNSLEKLPDSLVHLTNHTFVELKLGSNPWICDCEVLAMKDWLMVNKHAVTDGKTICCHSPRSMAGKKVVDMKAFMVCAEENHTVMYIIIAAVFTIGCVIFIFLVYLYMSHRARYIKWQLMNDECDGEFKTFDVFVCACSDIDDLAYVEDYLIPELEGRDFRVLYHKEHFDPGKSIHENMVLALDKSKRTLVFFSNRFIESEHSMFEFHYAHNLDIRKKKRRLITIKDTNLDMSKLDRYEVEYFNTHTYLDRDDPKFWKLLENGLPKKRLGRNVRRVP